MKLYMIKVPVAFFIEANEDHEMTSALWTIDRINDHSEESLYFGKPEIVAVFPLLLIVLVKPIIPNI